MPTDVSPAAAAVLLRELCGGAVHLPGDPGYDDARSPWNLQLDLRPAAVAYPALVDEVAELLRAAADLGLRVAAMGTGHGSAPAEGRLADAVLLRTSGLTGVRIDAARCAARVGAGALWGHVIERASPFGLTGLHMSSGNVGVVGSTLGGGISWYTRAHGLQASALTAVELVLADGTHVRADADHEPDLLWAARGGGGGFGVVTAMEFDLLPLRHAFAGLRAWDVREAEHVLRRWARWAPEAPECVTTSLRLMRLPDVLSIPEPLRGRHVVVLDGAVIGDLDRAPALLAPLREGPALLDTFAVTATADLVQLHEDPEGPLPAYASSALVGDLPAAAIDALLDTVGPDSGSSVGIAEVRQLGGALGRPAPRPGVLDRLDGGFLVIGIGLDPDPAHWQRGRTDVSALLAAVRPWETGRYLPMVDDSSVMSTWDAGVAARLDAVRRAADPHGLFALPPR